MKVSVTNEDGEKPIAKFEPGMRATLDMDTDEVVVLGDDEPFPDCRPDGPDDVVVVDVDHAAQSVVLMSRRDALKVVEHNKEIRQ